MNVSDTDAGTYQCHADNGVPPPEYADVTVNIKCEDISLLVCVTFPCCCQLTPLGVLKVTLCVCLIYSNFV